MRLSLLMLTKSQNLSRKYLDRRCNGHSRLEAATILHRTTSTGLESRSPRQERGQHEGWHDSKSTANQEPVQ